MADAVKGNFYFWHNLRRIFVIYFEHGNVNKTKLYLDI